MQGKFFKTCLIFWDFGILSSSAYICKLADVAVLAACAVAAFDYAHTAKAEIVFDRVVGANFGEFCRHLDGGFQIYGFLLVKADNSG